MSLPAYATKAHYDKMTNAELLKAFNDLVSKSKGWLDALAVWANRLPATNFARREVSAVLNGWSQVQAFISDAASKVKGAGGNVTALKGLPSQGTSLGFLPLVPVLMWLGTAAATALSVVGVRYAVVAACGAMGKWIYDATSANAKAKAEAAAIEQAKANALATAGAEAEIRQTLTAQGKTPAQVDAAVAEFRRKAEESAKDDKGFFNIDLEKGALIAAAAYVLAKYLESH